MQRRAGVGTWHGSAVLHSCLCVMHKLQFFCVVGGVAAEGSGARSEVSEGQAADEQMDVASNLGLPTSSAMFEELPLDEEELEKLDVLLPGMVWPGCCPSCPVTI